MARKNPLGTIKDVAAGTIRLPKTAAEKAVDGAKGGAELGIAVAGQVAARATGTVTSLLPGRKSAAPADLEPAVPAQESRKSQGDPVAPATKTPATKKAPAAKKAPATKSEVPSISPDKPVNVTKELGLDEAPVAAPTPETDTKSDEPLTAIDAAAEEVEVDVTPADIAPVVKKAAAKKAPAKKSAAKKAPAKKAAAKKTAASTPGDKLPAPKS